MLVRNLVPERNEFMLLIVKHSGTPDPSNHSSRASFEEEPQCWVDLSEPSKLDHYTAKQAASSYYIILRLSTYLCIRP